MARNLGRAAKRANKPNPREERNAHSTSRKQRRNQQFQHYGQESNDNIPKAKKVELLPRNISQENYLEALDDEENHIVLAMGPAGTGKTHMAVLWAIKQYQDGKINKIIVTRPQVGVDEEMGFLPGSILEKMRGWITPILDAFKEIYSVKQIEKMLEEEIIELSPLGFMRGRTFKNALVIADEMQNSTKNQFRMIVTRIGQGSRMIITGDIRQTDRPTDCGLEDFIKRLKMRGSNSMEIIEFGSQDIVRHEVIEEVLDLYDLTL